MSFNQETNDSKLVRRKKAFDIITEKSVHVLDMAETLYADGVISLDEIQKLKSSEDKKLELFKLLELANKKQTISLLDYEWQVLPTQKVLLTIICPSCVREFIYEAP